MNKLFVALLWVVFVVVSTVRAEDFSGTMQWSARIEFVDPQVASQMEMVQAALKNPELLSLLLQNPQLREMLESKLGPLSSSGSASSLLPTGFILSIKGQRAWVKTEGGLVSREVLSLADQHTAYVINRQARAYQKLPGPATAGSPSAVKLKVTRTTETAQILGYPCNRFIVEANDAGAKSRFSVWTTTAIKGFDAAAVKRLNWGLASGTDFMAQIEGVPLKVDAVTPDAKVALAATRITPGSVDGALFTLPAGFTQVSGTAY